MIGGFVRSAGIVAGIVVGIAVDIIFRGIGTCEATAMSVDTDTPLPIGTDTISTAICMIAAITATMVIIIPAGGTAGSEFPESFHLLRERYLVAAGDGLPLRWH